MTRRFLKQLLPFGILAGLFFATGTKAGINPMGKVWIYSCTFSVGGSVGVDGFVGIAGSHELGKKGGTGSTLSDPDEKPAKPT